MVKLDSRPDGPCQGRASPRKISPRPARRRASQTYIMDGAGQVLGTYPGGSRDGWVLPDGHVLLAVSKGKDHPGGAVARG